MAAGNLELFLKESAAALGAANVNITPETLVRYGENTLPGGDRRPSAVLYPSITAEVQAIVRLANTHKVPLYPISTGNNMGLGTRAAPSPGMVVVDCAKRMNRIIEIDETLAYAAVEPGVSFQMMADELARRGGKFIISTTSGPPQGGMLGNALDKGAGYGPMFDHFGFSCGMEVVLGNGEILRTGDGGMDHPERPNWHVSKYSFGPILDGLFAQSNFGIVTRLGIWLLPKPPAIRSFHFAYPGDDDLEEIIDLCRPLKLANFVPTLFRVSNDIYLAGNEDVYPDYVATKGKVSITDDQRRALQKKHGIGAWTVSGAFYGPSMAAMDGQIERVKQIFLQIGKGALHRARGRARDPAAQDRDQFVLGRADHGRARSAQMASGRRQHLVPARHADGRQRRQSLPEDRPRHLRKARSRLHGDERVRRALRPRSPRHHLQPRGRGRDAPRGHGLSRADRRLRRSRHPSRPRADRLLRLPYG